MSSSFKTALRYDDLSTISKPIWLRTTHPFWVYSETLRKEFMVPPHFESDGRSSPRIVWNIVPPVGPALWAAVPHDYLYKTGGYKDVNGKTVRITRAKADRVYFELMLLKGFSRFEAYVSYLMLRLFGWSAWNEHRNSEFHGVEP